VSVISSLAAFAYVVINLLPWVSGVRRESAS